MTRVPLITPLHHLERNFRIRIIPARPQRDPFFTIAFQAAGSAPLRMPDFL